MFDRNQYTSSLKVPENYFQDFKKDIMQQIATLEDKKREEIIIATTPKISMWRKSLSWSAIAATFLGVIFTLSIALDSPDQSTSNQRTSQNTLTSSTRTNDEAEFFQFIEEQSTRGVFNETLFSDEEIY